MRRTRLSCRTLICIPLLLLLSSSIFGCIEHAIVEEEPNDTVTRTITWPLCGYSAIDPSSPGGSSSSDHTPLPTYFIGELADGDTRDIFGFSQSGCGDGILKVGEMTDGFDLRVIQKGGIPKIEADFGQNQGTEILSNGDWQEYNLAVGPVFVIVEGGSGYYKFKGWE